MYPPYPRAASAALAVSAVCLITASIAHAELPVNDSRINASPITSIPFTAGPLDVTDATGSEDDPICYSNAQSVWYVLNAAQSGTLVANTVGSGYDTTLSVYEDSAFGLSGLGCNDDSDGTLASRVTFEAQAGRTYYFMVASLNSGASGTLTFSVDNVANGAPNDHLDSATPIPGLPFTASQDTRAATTDPSDPFCSGNAHNVWFAFTPSRQMRIEADTIGSAFDTTLSAYTGSSGALEFVACNDDYSGLQSRIAFNASAGVTYYFMISSFSSNSGGDMNLAVREAPPPPPPFEFSFTTNKQGELDKRTGTALVRGTLTCNRDTTIFVNGEIRQQVGRFITRRAANSTALFCSSSSPTSWSLSMQDERGTFVPGAPAKATLFGFGCDPNPDVGGGCLQRDTASTVHLRPQR